MKVVDLIISMIYIGLSKFSGNNGQNRCNHAVFAAIVATIIHDFGTLSIPHKAKIVRQQTLICQHLSIKRDLKLTIRVKLIH